MPSIYKLTSQYGRCWRLLLLALAVTVSLSAQAANLPLAVSATAHSTNAKTTADVTITGRVTDATTNEALAGCSVVLKGTQRGTTTDADGQYRITIPNANNAVLVFGFIGFVSQEVAVSNRTAINVALSSSASELSQVVVIGYGSTTKKDMTGSIKSVKSTDFNRGIINSPEQLIQGKVAGVNVTSASGEPGSSQTITIRGPGGVRTGSTPLFVLDGLPLDNSSTGGVTNPLTFLNPQDIESIDVLKDASATAIYGARGANGVVLITTKKGKSGSASLTLSSSLGISKMARPLPVFTADEFREQVKALGGVLDDKGGSTDWQKEISQTAYTQNHNLSFSGGSDKLTYYGSVGVQNQQGVLKNSQLDRYTGRINATQRMLDDRLTLDVNLNASYTNNQRPPGNSAGSGVTTIGGAISANPTFPAYDSAGDPFQYQGATNPLITLKLEKDITTTNRIVANISPSYKILKNLVYKLNFGIDNSSAVRDQQSLANAVPQQDGRLLSTYTTNRNVLVENYFTYTLTKTNHNLTALLGHSYQNFFVQERNWSINKFPITPVEPIYNPGLGQELTLANNRPTGFALKNELQSFFGRVNYQFNDKYLVTATVRADGSSKFGANNKYGVFPSFSAGWRLSEESFLKSGPFTDLKLRAGWGQTGNQEIPAKITQALFTAQVSNTTSYPLDGSTSYPAGISYTRLANPDIQWEVSSQTDLGLDFAVFKGALSGSVDYFRKVSNKILLEVIPADPVQPASTYWTNVPNMSITNQGLELDLNYRYASLSGFRFDIGGNITFIDNVVRNSPYSVITSGSAQGSGLTSATVNGYINGQPIGTFFLKEFTGFDEKGISTYRDADGDGIVTDKDRIAAGSALPTKQFNINSTLAYKGFDLAINFNGVSGNKIYDNTANASFYKLRLSKGLNSTPEAIQYAQESINNSAPVSTRYLKSGSFFRLNNLALGYNLNPKSIGINRWLNGIRISVTAQNLFVITKYDGYDPEVNTDRAVNGISSFGIDYLSYPKARSVIFGLNLTF
ncbi:SusC/RagA family TonB-linked outer membrane protein [Spirosoma oryzicola]|uniref:SusC/RagA family TonB-linked outer membrane protein n=1 Tax=Spirosoma oryzicola TaxID=2898794 RepID=UPI001E38AD59|nr:SusC/RagA family TonB-linked outer membrane protein [Spirosoma oryzicola]UHG89566.1 SusC/RagA family TonB-linked outer membrane protein [Spirosoma oryzicola]